MNTQIPTLYLLLAAVIGIFIGLLIASLFSSRESQPKKQPPKEVVKEGFGEVARLWYSPAVKKILVEMDGGHYKEFSALSKDQQAKALRLGDLLKNWTVVEPVSAPVETPQVEAPAYVPIVPDRFVEEAEPYEPPHKEIEYADLFEEQEENTRTAEPVNPFVSELEEEPDLVSVLQQSLDEDVAGAAAKPEVNVNLSITQQISAILDEMLIGTEMADEGIKLVENEEHGVDVWVGVEKYTDIDEVPYPQVRQVIRDAVLRWEQENDSQKHLED